jgi:hypothetical protein
LNPKPDPKHFESRIQIWIRIRNSLKSRIRIRNKKFGTHNTVCYSKHFYNSATENLVCLKTKLGNVSTKLIFYTGYAFITRKLVIIQLIVISGLVRAYSSFMSYLQKVLTQYSHNAPHTLIVTSISEHVLVSVHVNECRYHYSTIRTVQNNIHTMV